MDLFNVIFSPKARGQLDDYIGYIQYVFLSEEAAKRVYDDAMETVEALSKVAASLQYCKNSELRAYGYRPIFFRRHQYVMLYRVEGKTAYVDAVYHQKQDYENYFLDELS